MLTNLWMGFRIAAGGSNLFFMLVGVFWGIIAGALPGITGSIGMALLLPFTFGMHPATALMMLAGVYIGAMYGGSITAILIRTPGTPASAATVLDGYELHKQGKSGKALGISLICGFIGGVISVVLLVVMVLPLSRISLAFGPAEYFALTLFGLTIISGLSGKNVVKGIISAILGLVVAMAGIDPFTGHPRFTFGKAELLGGVDIIAAMIGLFAISEVLVQAGEKTGWERIDVKKVSTEFPTWRELKGLMPLTLFSSIIGTVVGVMPGAGGSIAGFIAYNEAKRWSKHPELFGKGSYEGVCAPETANNAVTGGAIVPLLAFGIPGSNAAAVLLGAILLHGLIPGPLLFQRNPDVVYSLFSGMLIANVVMLLLGYVAIKPSIYAVNVPKPVLLATILGLVSVGCFSINNITFEIGIALLMGVLGYFMRLYDFSPASMVLGLVLGYQFETNFRRALMLSQGSYSIFFTRPISLVLVILSVITFVGPLVREIRQARRQAEAIAA